jgi:tripeptidyl-peptidase-1
MLSKSFSIVAAAIFIIDAFASPLSPDIGLTITKRRVPSTHNLHERHLSPLALQWTKKERLPRTVHLPMRIGLKQVNFAAGEERLLEM